MCRAEERRITHSKRQEAKEKERIGECNNNEKKTHLPSPPAPEKKRIDTHLVHKRTGKKDEGNNDEEGKNVTYKAYCLGMEND